MNTRGLLPSTGYSTSPPSFTSNPSPPPSYASESDQTRSAEARSLSSASNTSFGSTDTLPAARHVYYRMYSQDDAIAIRNPEFGEDPFLGHVLAHRIPPPHSAAGIKRYLCRREGIADYARASLFLDFSCLNPLENTDLVDVMNPAGAGYTPGDPIALITSESCEPPNVTTGYATSQPGRLNSLQNTDVMNSGGHLHSERPGCSPYTSESSQLTNITAGNTASPRPVPVSPVSRVPHSAGRLRPYDQKLLAIRDYDASIARELWLSFKKGDILSTDGVLENVHGFDCFWAINSAGRKGVVRLRRGFPRSEYLKFLEPSTNP